MSPHVPRVAGRLPPEAPALEGAPLHVPRKVEAVLVREYRERVLERSVFRGWRFDRAHDARLEGSDLQRPFERLTGG